MSEGTPTTEEHWMRFADDLMKRADRAEARVKELEERVTELGVALKEMVESPVVFQDPRISYLEIQVQRVVLKDAERVLRGEER